MAKMTLLEIVQDILNDMDSDNVSDIAETVESEQVASIVRRTYFNLMDELDLPHTAGLVKLTASGTTARPTHMSMPDNISKLLWVKYDVREAVSDPIAYRTIKYMEPYDFITMLSSRDSTDTTNVQSVSDPSGVTLLIGKVNAPSYWTSLDDETIIFDSYDSALDSTLQNSKTLCHAYLRPTWTHTNAAIPDLPENLFSLLVAEARASCFALLKGQPNPKAELTARRFRIRSQRNRWRENGELHTPDYGRK